jgi:hypothetical protein
MATAPNGCATEPGPGQRAGAKAQLNAAKQLSLPGQRDDAGISEASYASSSAACPQTWPLQTSQLTTNQATFALADGALLRYTVKELAATFGTAART